MLANSLSVVELCVLWLPVWLAAGATAVTPGPTLIRVPAGTDTLHEALERARNVSGAAVLELAPGGVYRLTEPLVVTPRKIESGKIESVSDAYSPWLTVRTGSAAAGAGSDPTNPATITGGVPLPAASWAPQTPLKSKNDSRAVVWEAALPVGYDPSDLGLRYQLWRGSTRQTLARSPDLQYVHANRENITFKSRDILSTYYDFESVHLVLYESWTASYHRLTSVDATNHVAVLASPFNNQWANQASGSRYYIENCREEMDEIGEFYVDAKNQKVLYTAAAGDDLRKSTAENLFWLSAGPRELVVLRGDKNGSNPVRDVEFASVVFAHTAVEDAFISQGASGQSGDFLTTAAVHASFAEGIRLSNCTMRALGGYGIWFEQGAFDGEVVGCALRDLGAGGIRIGRGHGFSGSEGECERHNVTDNVITDGGHIWQEGCGVLSQHAASIDILHNEISYMRYTGVSTGWTWGYGRTVVHHVRTMFNHIHHIGLGYLSDMGAFLFSNCFFCKHSCDDTVLRSPPCRHATPQCIFLLYPHTLRCHPNFFQPPKYTFRVCLHTRASAWQQDRKQLLQRRSEL